MSSVSLFYRKSTTFYGHGYWGTSDHSGIKYVGGPTGDTNMISLFVGVACRLLQPVGPTGCKVYTVDQPVGTTCCKVYTYNQPVGPTGWADRSQSVYAALDYV